MYLYVYMELCGFYFPEPTSQPQVLLFKDRVLDACALARKRGVMPGLAAREAKTLLREPLAFRQYEDADFRDRRNAWLNLCLTSVDSLQALLAHQALLDFSAHPDPVGVGMELVFALRRRGYNPRIGWGPSPWVARRCARQMPAFDPIAWTLWGEEVLREPRQILAPCPTLQASPLDPAVRRRLHDLGYHTLGELDSVPLPVLRRHLGQQTSLFQAVREGGPWVKPTPNYPDQRLIASHEFVGGCDLEQVVEAATHRLTRRLVEQLARRDETSSELILEIENEEGQIVRVPRSFTKPLSSTAQLHRAITLTLPAMTQPMSRLQVELCDLKKKGQVQGSLDGTPDRKESLSAAQQALSTLKKAFGETVVQRADEIPRSRRVQVLQAWHYGTSRSLRV